MRILREPLLHFMVLGALVYVAARHFDANTDRYRIDAGADQRARIATTYEQQYGVPPTDQQLQYLLDQYVRSEILFREGLALGLDRDDEIVRRRVVQKIEFLNEDTDAIVVGDDQLEKFFAAHQSSYVTPAAVSFRHVYFSADAQWDYFDVASPTRPDAIHQTTESSERGTSFEVPAGLTSGTSYYTILRVTGGAIDWIPLPGTVMAC